MREFIKKYLKTPAQLTLSHGGQLSQIAGIIEDIQDDIVLLKAEEGMLAADIKNLLFLKLLPQKESTSGAPFSVPQESTSQFAPSLNMPMGSAQTIL